MYLNITTALEIHRVTFKLYHRRRFPDFIAFSRLLVLATHSHSVGVKVIK